MKFTRISLVYWVLVAVLAGSWPLLAFQDTHPVTGRRIAGVMGVGGADWLERPERETEEQPRKRWTLSA